MTYAHAELVLAVSERYRNSRAAAVGIKVIGADTVVEALADQRYAAAKLDV